MMGVKTRKTRGCDDQGGSFFFSFPASSHSDIPSREMRAKKRKEAGSRRGRQHRTGLRRQNSLLLSVVLVQFFRLTLKSFLCWVDSMKLRFSLSPSQYLGLSSTSLPQCSPSCNPPLTAPASHSTSGHKFGIDV